MHSLEMITRMNMKGVYTHSACRERMKSGQWLDIPRHERLWNRYCELRDELKAIYDDCIANSAAAPAGIEFFFTSPKERFKAIGMPPTFRYPKNQLKWMRNAIARCQQLIKHPNGK